MAPAEIPHLKYCSKMAIYSALSPPSKLSKGGGTMAVPLLVAAIALEFIELLALPSINTAQTRSSTFRPIHKKLLAACS